MIRILIADDSAFMRQVLSDLFNKQADFTVVGTAINGKAAVEQVLKLHPDILTLDVNMPVMDGLSALAVIMKDCPLPVVMLSSLTKEGAEATIQALSLGAVDFITKAGGEISKIDTIESVILEKCRSAARANLSGIKMISHEPLFRHIGMPERRGYQKPDKKSVTDILAARRPQVTLRNAADPLAAGERLIAIGSSTGGPRALQEVIKRLPKNLPCGVVVVQHMPKGFTKSLADRLDSLAEVSVKEAENHDIIEAGHVYIAPGDFHMRVQQEQGHFAIELDQHTPPQGSLRPCVNILFDSLVSFGRQMVSVILTGMGSDGAAGTQKIKNAGGYVIAESKSTAVIYGMPKAVVELGIADEVLPVYDIAEAIVGAVKK